MCYDASSPKPKQSLHASITRHTEDGWLFALPPTVKECQVRCRALQTKIRFLHKDAAHHCSEEQHAALHHAEATGDRPHSKLLRRLIAAENLKAMFLKLRNCCRTHSAGLTKLKVPRNPEVTDYGACTKWITVDTPVEVEQRLRERNQRHFGQAEGLFPTIPPFSEWVDWSASTHTAELLLEGNLPIPSNLDPLTADLLAHLRRQCSLDDIPGPISIDDWTAKIRNWPESTSTSPSGFHLTHSKALIARHNVDPESPEGTELEQMRQAMTLLRFL